MSNLQPGDSIDALQAAYEEKWSRGANSLFLGLKSVGCSTIADVAAKTAAEILHTKNLGMMGFPRILMLLDENQISHSLRVGLSPAIEARWKRNAERGGAGAIKQ